MLVAFFLFPGLPLWVFFFFSRVYESSLILLWYIKYFSTFYRVYPLFFLSCSLQFHSFSLTHSHAASPVIPHPERLPGQWILGKDACLVRSTDWVHAAGSALVWV